MSKKVYMDTEREMRGFFFNFILTLFYPFLLKMLNANDLQASMLCGGDLVAGQNFVDR